MAVPQALTPFFKEIDACWILLARELARQHADSDASAIEHSARKLLETAAFGEVCRQRGVAVEELCGDREADGEALPIDGTLLRTVQDRLKTLRIDSASAWPADALGWIHERLLGRRVVRSRTGKIEAGVDRNSQKGAGIFYTPACVCEYIAGAALDRQLRDSPEAHLAILDPACGCGAFLLAAYRHLRTWHEQRGLPWEPARWLTGLHGIDADREAVLVARRSLWLEARACETERLRCGDVLLAPPADWRGKFDVVLGNPPYRRELGTKAWLDRIAATEFGRRWRMPRMDLWYYFLHRGLELLKPGGRLSFIVGSYWTSGRGSRKLIDALRDSVHVEEIFSLGRLPVFPNVAGQHLILTVVKRPQIDEGTSVAFRSAKVAPFCGAKGDTAAHVVPPVPTDAPTLVKAVDDAKAGVEDVLRGRAYVAAYEKTASQLFRGGGIDLGRPCDEFLAPLSNLPPLAQFGAIRQGIAENPACVTRKASAEHGARWPPGEGVFVLTAEELARLDLPERETALLRPYRDLCDLGRYELARRPSRWLIYTTPQTCPDIDKYPAIRRHLERFRPLLERRRETRLGRRPWWQLHWPREEALWQASKVLSVQMGARPAFVPAQEPAYVPFSVNVFVPRPEAGEHLFYFAALLNSRLLWKWFRHHAKRRGVGLEINGHVLARAPVRPIDFGDPSDADCHNRLVDLVGRMLAVQGRRRNVAEEDAKETLDREIADIDAEIDRLVCELYGLDVAEA